MIQIAFWLTQRRAASPPTVTKKQPKTANARILQAYGVAVYMAVLASVVVVLAVVMAVFRWLTLRLMVKHLCKFGLWLTTLHACLRIEPGSFQRCVLESVKHPVALLALRSEWRVPLCDRNVKKGSRGAFSAARGMVQIALQLTQRRAASAPAVTKKQPKTATEMLPNHANQPNRQPAGYH